MEEQFLMLFDKMKIEMQIQSAQQTETITKTIMDRMDMKLEPILAENKNLKLKVERLEKEIEYLKKEKRNNNIVIFGLKEDNNSTLELLSVVLKIFRERLELNVEEWEVNKIHRIGKINKESDKPRPVLLSFVNSLKKKEIMKKKNLLKNKRIYITEDYPKEVIEIRKALQPKVIEERSKGNIAYIHYDKLIIKENKSNKDKRKREVSLSPQSSSQPKKQQTFTSSKANRTNAFDIMRGRSNSLSIYPGGKNQ
ncbi:uncharacterized protein [Epargyreus clarus]|uniref:uncharacterized protein n=1 Tax=Epargyreus clarus TaxID=520877 RepID=UPI003C2D4858